MLRRIISHVMATKFKLGTWTEFDDGDAENAGMENGGP